MRLLISHLILICVVCLAHAHAPKLAIAKSLAGGIVVNSDQDNEAADAVLTLREAILIANGGTSPNGLNRPITLGERDQLTGCQYILIPPALSTALILSGCGENEPETITLSGVNLIMLINALPMIADANTMLDGAGVQINAATVVSDSTFSINASHTTLSNLTIINTPNTASDVEIFGGTANVIHDMNLGANAGATVCAGRPSAQGIAIHKEVTGSDDESSVYVYANSIGCHNQAGILVEGAGFVRIGERADGTRAANTIGQNNGGQALPNSVGILLDGMTTNSVIATRIVGNHIGGNISNGIELRGEPGFGNTAKRVEQTMIIGNRIGVDAANGGCGIYLSGTNLNNVIGGQTDEDRNVISGNGQHGIFAENPTSVAAPNLAMAYIGGNYIGTTITGTARLPNQGHGIYLKNASAFIGVLGVPAALVAGNRIAGNAQDGVRIEASFAFVMANTIGTDPDEHALGNGGDGINMLNGAAYMGYYPLPGATATGNRVQFNQRNGLWINGGEAVIGGNTFANNVQNGVRLTNGANKVVLGLDEPAGYGNVVRANGGNGVWIESTLTATLSTSLSSSVVISNGGYGVLLEGAGTQATVISATLVAGNSWDGVAEKNGAAKNSWTKLETYANGGLGIDKTVTSDKANIPNKPNVLFTAAGKPDASSTRFSGKSTPAAIVEVYILAPDPSTYGEGKTFLGSTVTDASGRWRLSVPDVAPLGCYTAFETVVSSSGAASSSEYSKSSCIQETFLPVVTRR